VDKETGLRTYKTDYLDQLKRSGKSIPNSLKPDYSLREIMGSFVRGYGAFHLFHSIAQSMGLLDILKKVLPSNYAEIFTLASYLVTSGEPAMYCEDWVHETECLPCGSMSSQKISKLLQEIGENERDAFFCEWGKLRREREYLALDITSISSWSALIDEVEWGYNRDKEDLPQINLCMLMGQQSRLPVFQIVYSGSIKDVKTFKNTIGLVDAILGGIDDVLYVMDKGFFSAKNVNSMMSGKNGGFIIGVPFTTKFAVAHVENERSDIDRLDKVIVTGSESVRGVTKHCALGKEKKVYAHIYFNALKAAKRRESLYSYVTTLKELALKNHEDSKNQSDFKKYLSIQASQKNGEGVTVSIREDVIANELKTAGWMVLLSDRIDNAKEALLIYRAKDVVEKGFYRLKNCLEMERLRVHSSENMQGKVFVSFIALILMSYIHNVMVAKGLYKHMSIQKMIKLLDKQKIQEINDSKIIFPATKEQEEIFKSFGIKPPSSL
jgi:transposase